MPDTCSVLALNASQMLLTGVERQSVLPPGCDFSSAVFDSVFNFNIFFVTPHDHEPNKT